VIWLLLILAIPAAWWILLYLMQDAMMFPAQMAPRPARFELADHYAGSVLLERPIEGGMVEAWLIPSAWAASSPGGLVVFFHGNAEIIDQQAWIVEHYRRLGLSVLLIEYRGYGRSAGRPSQRALTDDADRFLSQALKRGETDPRRVAYHGRSIGGAVAAQLAERFPPRALILESTFVSGPAMARKFLAPGFIMRHPFHTDRVLAAYPGPVLLLHGAYDSIIPVSHSRRLASIAADATLVEFPADHNDMPGPGEEPRYWRAIAEHLRTAGVLDDE
jgi:fermentation-respiration switch protein FrsA (DUF1100 family)